jgi:hypothetical protein
VRKAVPDRTLYIYYSVSGNAGPWTWGPGYPHMKQASDLPSTESYFDGRYKCSGAGPQA